jgi:hypothetical protein
VQSVRLGMVLLLALAVAAVIGFTQPSALDGALNAWQSFAAKLASMRG